MLCRWLFMSGFGKATDSGPHHATAAVTRGGPGAQGPGRRRRGALIWAAVSSCVAFLALLLRLLPAQPWFPVAELDASWQWAMDYAVAHGLAIGRDVVFTYGPYSGLASRLYAPAVRGMLIGSAVVLATAYAAGLSTLRRPASVIGVAALLPMIGTEDAFAFTVSLPVMLACAGAVSGPSPRTLPVAVLLLAPALALLPLVKLSYLPFTIIGMVTVAWLVWLGRRTLLLGLFVAVFALALPAVWLASGQSLAWLPAYFSNGSSIIAGYAAGMALFGPMQDIGVALGLAALLLLLLTIGLRGVPRRAAMPLLIGVAGMAFVALKAGFVRQDGFHELEPLDAAGLALLICAAWLPNWPALIAAAVGIFLLAGPPNASAGFAPVWSGLRAEIDGTAKLLRDPAAFAADYRMAVAAIPRLAWHPPGTADIYSSGQSSLFASGLSWSPRPVIQSYSAYTPALARLNANHLLGPRAADNIFFRPEPIDGHLPALEDGASWPALLSLYDPAGYDAGSDLVWLQRSAMQVGIPYAGPSVLDGRRGLGEMVSLPNAPALWAKLTVTPTLAGDIASFLIKSSKLTITLHLAGGETRQFRFIPGMAEAGFLLSPLVTTTGDFVRLRPVPGRASPGLPRVVSFSLDAAQGTRFFWHRTYQLSVAPIAFPPMANAALELEPRPAPVVLPPAVSGPTCYLDSVDGLPVDDAPVKPAPSFRVAGWGAFDVQAGIAADDASLAFISKSGDALAVQAFFEDRRDVGAVFHHPELLRVGVRAVADLSVLAPGTYSVQLILRHGADAETCPTRLRVVVPGQ
jgi:hypothetical protein